ncbi:MAG: DUF371 domain-containing protein [Thaumarchaeota archaeon]|nr:DUF371 domain-containing protein [Nitrososphaerota archaeon]
MVRSLHPTTIEVTAEEHLTPRGDCIIGVGGTKGCAQLDERVKDGLRTAGSKVRVKIVAGAESFVVNATGDPRLELSHEGEIVIRRSSFVSGRTLAVGADAAAKDLPRSMVALLRSGDTSGFLEIEVG